MNLHSRKLQLGSADAINDTQEDWAEELVRLNGIRCKAHCSMHLQDRTGGNEGIGSAPLQYCSRWPAMAMPAKPAPMTAKTAGAAAIIPQEPLLLMISLRSASLRLPMPARVRQSHGMGLPAQQR